METAQAVDDLMTSDFLERTRFAAQPVLASVLARLRAQMAVSATASPHRRRSSASSAAASSIPPSRQLSADESAELERLAALRLTDGDVVNQVVSWLEGIAGSNGKQDEGIGDGPPEQLQEVLLPLVMGLQRMGRLPATLRDFRGTCTARLKEVVRCGCGFGRQAVHTHHMRCRVTAWRRASSTRPLPPPCTGCSQVIDSCLDALDPPPPSGDASHLMAYGGQRTAAGPLPSSVEPPSAATRLQQLPGREFEWVLEAVVLVVKTLLNHCHAVGVAVQGILTGCQAARLQASATAHDLKECSQAVAEAAAVRWSKLLGFRARGGSNGSDGVGSGGSSTRLVAAGLSDLV